MNDQITISATSIAKFCPNCKAKIIELLGLTFAELEKEDELELDDSEWEYAELGLQAARAFLQGCNAKTRQTLQSMVDTGATFSLRQLESQMGAEEGGLRGVWTGLTKRTRTITGDPDALLINWSDQTTNGDWTGRLNATTLQSFTRALAE